MDSGTGTASVPIDEIDANQTAGRNPYDAVVEAGVSRLRPVVQCADKTIRGVVPLLRGNLLDLHGDAHHGGAHVRQGADHGAGAYDLREIAREFNAPM